MKPKFLSIPEPMVNIARGLHEKTGMKDAGVTFETFLLLCLVDGLYKHWQVLERVASEVEEVREFLRAASQTEDMRKIKEFIDPVIEKLGKKGINDRRF